jgi:hypothetical protein
MKKTCGNLLWKLWNDESGFIISMEMVIIATLLVIGLVASLAELRDALANEISDIATAVSVLNQSYAYGGLLTQSGSADGGASNTGFLDAPDTNDTNATTGNGLTISVWTAATTTE